MNYTPVYRSPRSAVYGCKHGSPVEYRTTSFRGIFFFGSDSSCVTRESRWRLIMWWYATITTLLSANFLRQLKTGWSWWRNKHSSAGFSQEYVVVAKNLLYKSVKTSGKNVKAEPTEKYFVWITNAQYHINALMVSCCQFSSQNP